MKKIKIICTLGPSSYKKKILYGLKKHKVDLVRINLSHTQLNEIKKKIIYLKKNNFKNICIDTEGAQIRTVLNGSKLMNIKEGNKLKITKKNKKLNFYPNEVFSLLKKNDLLDVGFEGLQLKVLRKSKDTIILKCTNSGTIENNKGVHLKNRKIKLNFVTEKDLRAIKIAKKLNIKNFALSFTNSSSDMIKFCNLLPKDKKFFKIETMNGLKSINYFFKKQKNFLIDRGDLSKDIGIENVPLAQRLIFKRSKKFRNINIVVATNFLESMITKPYPTRAEVNDIYNSLEMGAKGLVLAGETAMGKHPIECVKLLSKIINVFNSKKKFYV